MREPPILLSRDRYNYHGGSPRIVAYSMRDKNKKLVGNFRIERKQKFLHFCYLFSYLPTVPTYLYTIPTYLPTYCTYISTVPTYLLYLPTYCTYLFTIPTYLLYLPIYCTNVPIVPTYLLYLPTYCTYFPDLKVRQKLLLNTKTNILIDPLTFR